MGPTDEEEEMCLLLHKNFCLKHFSCHLILMNYAYAETDMCCHILVKRLNTKFHENLSRNSVVVACIRMDKQAQ